MKIKWKIWQKLKFEDMSLNLESLESKRPLEWWRLRARSGHYKYLSKLAKKVLCNTVTSVPNETIFSSAGNIISEKRSCL